MKPPSELTDHILTYVLDNHFLVTIAATCHMEAITLAAHKELRKDIEAFIAEALEDY